MSVTFSVFQFYSMDVSKMTSKLTGDFKLSTRSI